MSEDGSVQNRIKDWLSSLKDLSFQSFSSCPYEVDESVKPKDCINNQFDLENEIQSFSGNVKGQGSFVLKNGDYFEGEFFGTVHERNGHFTFMSEGQDRFAVGHWQNDLMEGIIDIENPSGGWTRGCYSRGLKHGLERKFDSVYGKADNLQRIAYYCNDQVVGKVWQCLIGGAYLVGTVDSETEKINGKDIIYVYPDLKTAIQGRFVDGHMVSGQMCSIEDAYVDPETHMMSVTVTEEKYGPKLKRDVSTDTVISRYPLDQDLWESSRVEARVSGLGESAGEGLYTRTYIGEGQILALFNGVRTKSCRNNKNDKPNQSYDYRIRLNGEEDIDIPPQFTSLSSYRATIGHKANHSFNPNAKWARIEHPRFGLITAIRAIKNLAPGEEVLVNYGMGMSDAPNWYKTLWVEHLRSKGQSNDEILDWCSRQYSMNGRLIELPLA